MEIIMIKHLKEHVGKYASILGIFPLIFLANLAMPTNMSFATAAQVNENRCRLAWIDYESSLNKLDKAEYREKIEPSERNRDDVTKYSIDVDKALNDIDKYC
jgi:hypothetical protein